MLKGLWLTIALGSVFTAIQAYEYANAPFGFDVTDPSQGRWVARAALAAAGLPV